MTFSGPGRPLVGRRRGRGPATVWRVGPLRVRGASAALLFLLAVGLVGCNSVVRALMAPEEPPEGQRGLSLADLPDGALELVVQGLEVPWEIAFLPNGDFLVTERPGRLTRFSPRGPGAPPLGPQDGRTWTVEGVLATGEGGLMGLALHPSWWQGAAAGAGSAVSVATLTPGAPEPPGSGAGAGAPTAPAGVSDLGGWVYLMLTAQGPGGTENRVVRFTLNDGELADPVTIIGGIPGNRFHDGGRIAFGPDGYLYVTTGDAGESSSAQDRSSLAGKILRLDDMGGIPADNPFGSPVWSLGHRNPQGLAWDDGGRLWSTEHGRSGLQSGMDELNLIRAGENYGWPEIEGDRVLAGLQAPELHSGADYTWAPAGIASIGDRLFFGGLRGEALYEVLLDAGRVTGPVVHFSSELGRIRAVVAGPDGMLYLSTSNRDGRGSALSGDDKILRLDPAALRR